MKTLTKDCGQKDVGVRKRKCLSCELGVFCRNHYYRGKLLTEHDFQDEQQYLINKHRLHNVALHGWGIVCGLRVKPHPHCPELRVIVEQGYAIDGCGREIRVLKEVQVELPPAPEKDDVEPCPEPPPYEEPEQHDHGEAVADAGLEFGGVERLREGGHGVEGEDGSSHENGGQPRTDFSTGLFDELHTRLCFCCLSSAASPPNTR